MTHHTERNNRKTDQAWNKVYHRLEQEGLLNPKERDLRTHRQLRRTVITSVAAAILLCVYLSVNYFKQTEKEDSRPLLSQQNVETTTLATTLEDGSVVYLGGNATIQYPVHFQSEKREVSLQGNALFDVVGNHVCPFFIETDDAYIEVLGTSFHVRSERSLPFELSVQSGRVKVTLKKSGQDVYVKAGETATLTSRQLRVTPTADSGLFAAYVRQIRFKDERLADILRIINRHTGPVQFETSPELANRQLTVTFSDNSPEAIAELICFALNLKQTRSQNLITLYK